ncbi:MAG: ribonuclease P protein component [Candidatus Doudnabacteria bacterium]|nr:ribonuclease P protein component [Candidatus Doudnabacteria bacterium]
MLPKTNRLNKEREIIQVLRTGNRKSGRLLTAVSAASLKPYPRIGFLVSKKVSNKTNQRNLVKRRLRYIVAQFLASLNPATNSLLIARTGANLVPFSELKREAKSLFEKLHLFRGARDKVNQT